MNIYLLNSVISDLELSDEEIAVYVALRSIYSSQRDFQTISYNMLCYELYNDKPTQRYAEAIKSAFHSLVDKDMIRIVKQFSPTEFSVDMSNLFFENDYYTVLYLEEVHKIMNVVGRVDRFKLLRYFITCLRTINQTQGVYDDNSSETITGFCGFMPQSYLCTACGINPTSTHLKSAEQYNSVLEENKLLYIYRHNKMAVDDSGVPKSLNNHYGRWKDQKNIKKFAIQYEEHLGLETEVSSKSGNEHRRLSAYYNNLCRDFERYSEEYSIETQMKIFFYVQECNRRIKEEMGSVDKNSDYYKQLSQRLRDMNVLYKLPCVDAYINDI